MSTLSYYILTSSFDYEHVIKFHGSIESSSIEITSYGYTDMGSIAHSLSYTAVAKALDRKLYRLVNMEYPWNSKRRKIRPPGISTPKDITMVEQA